MDKEFKIVNNNNIFKCMICGVLTLEQINILNSE